MFLAISHVFIAFSVLVETDRKQSVSQIIV